jgi:hypothetical protein
MKEICASGDCSFLSPLHFLRHARPFFTPGLVVALAALRSLSRWVDLVHGRSRQGIISIAMPMPHGHM